MRTYYRGTNNPHEPNIIASGNIRISMNLLDGIKEAGLSVSDEVGNLFDRFSIVCKVTGDPLKDVGSDGETLLDVNTVRLIL